MIYQRIILLLAAMVLVLAGCQTPPLYNQTDDNVADVSQRTKDALAKSDAAANRAPPLVVNAGQYVDRTPINLARDPRWLKSKIIIHGGQLPFSYYTRTIIGGKGHLLIHYQTGVDPTILTSIDYTGTVQGALDLLAAKTGYVYSVNGYHVTWQAYITKTFDIAFMPGNVNYVLGGSAAGGGASEGGPSMTGTNTQTGSTSVWRDLQSTIQALLSTDGKVLISESTTTVTVRDKPANVALVGKYIENLNKNLSKQVLIKVQVLEVILNSAFNYGIDWTVAQHTFGNSNFVLSANEGTPISIRNLQTGNVIPSMGLQSKATTTADGPSGITALIKALKQQGKVSVVSEPRIVCLNNQVSTLQIIDKQGYAQSTTVTTIPTSTTPTTQTAITPGNITTGLILYLLPKILGNKVYLNINADLSNLLEIQGFGDPATGRIQMPHTSEKQFNQRGVIGSGDTLILAGFRQINNQSGAVQLLDSQALGGKGAAQSSSETVLLITPIVLGGFV